MKPLSPSLVVLAVISVLLAAGGLTWYRAAMPCLDGAWSRNDCPVVVVPPPPKLCEPAWSCGRLARGEAGMKKDVWYLKYEDVGGTSVLELSFTDDAVCKVDGEVADCALMNPPNGSGTSFSGRKDGDLFVVSRLDFTTRR